MSRPHQKSIIIFFFFFLPVRHPAGLDGFVGCSDLTYLRDSLTNIRIRVLSPGRPSIWRIPHSPYYFLGAEYICPCCALPPLVYACVRLMLKGLKLICLSRAGLPPALYCAWSQETMQTQIICPSPQVPFVYPVSGLGDGRREIKNHLRYSHTFLTNLPDRESNPDRQCDRPECYH